jgi:hypothetical protein
MSLWADFGSVVSAWKRNLRISLTIKTNFTGYTKSMNLKLERLILDDKATIGSLYCDGVFLCHTLEDPARKVKLYGKTCIPSGLYSVDYTWSGRFDRLLPLLGDVPLYFGIRIHGGNTAENTEGCILAISNYEKTPEGWFGSYSQKALALVCQKFEQNPTGTHTIEIVGGYSAQEMSNGST